MPSRNNSQTDTLGTAFKLLAVPLRRQLLSRLYEAEQSVVLDELIDGLRSETEVTKTPEQLQIELLEIHLPKLTAHGVLEFDEEN